MDDKSKRTVTIATIFLVIGIICIGIFIAYNMMPRNIEKLVEPNRYYYPNGSPTPNLTNDVVCRMAEFDVRCQALVTDNFSICTDVIQPYLKGHCADHFFIYKTILATSASDCSKIQNLSYKLICEIKISTFMHYTNLNCVEFKCF